MNRLTSLLGSVIIALLIPGLVYAGDSCDRFCGKLDAEAKAALANPTCAKDPNCVKCVRSAQLESQSGLQCSAASGSKKGKAGEVIFAAINTAATVVCGTACTISLLPAVGQTSERAWSQACGWAGFSVTATELGYSIEQMLKGEKVDYLGLAMQAYGAKSTLAMISEKGAQHVVDGLNATKKRAGNLIKNPACLNSVMYGYAAQQKIKSIKKSSDSAKAACDNALKYQSPTGSPIQACLAPTFAKNNITSSTQLAGMYSATAEVYAKASIDDVTHLAATSALNDSLKSLKPDMDMATAQGKLDYDGIAKKLDAGADLSSILADANLNPDLLTAIKNATDSLTDADAAKLSGVMGQGAAPTYSAPAALASTGGESGVGDLSFGVSGAVPGEGSESLEIERAPAGAKVGELSDDGDIFHGAFGGTIFDIVTTRLKAEKSNYAELDPEGRMNRLFNGYKETNAKSARKPAGGTNRSAR